MNDVEPFFSINYLNKLIEQYRRRRLLQMITFYGNTKDLASDSANGLKHSERMIICTCVRSKMDTLTLYAHSNR